MAEAAVVQHLDARHHLPGVGVAVHVNHPRHDGDTPLHDHDFLEIALVADGRALHRTVRGRRPVAAGDLLVIHPRQWHAWERCSGLSLWNCCIGSAVLARELAWTASDPTLGPLLPALRAVAGSAPDQGVLAARLGAPAAAASSADLQRIRLLQASTDAVRHGPEIIARVLLLLGRTAFALADRRLPTHLRPLDLHPGIDRAVQAMDARLDHPWGLAELARLTGMSRFQLVRSFRRHFGNPPMAWLNHRRVEHAAVLLLTTDLAMAAIARQVGWSDANYFSRRFRAVFRQSPRAYRNQLPLPALKPAADWVQW